MCTSKDLDLSTTRSQLAVHATPTQLHTLVLTSHFGFVLLPFHTSPFHEGQSHIPISSYTHPTSAGVAALALLVAHLAFLLLNNVNLTLTLTSGLAKVKFGTEVPPLPNTDHRSEDSVPMYKYDSKSQQSCIFDELLDVGND